MDAAPTPRPATKRPTYIKGRLPLPAELAWKMTPTTVMAPVPISAQRLPHRSVSQGVTKQAAKHPAWSVEATAICQSSLFLRGYQPNLLFCDMSAFDFASYVTYPYFLTSCQLSHSAQTPFSGKPYSCILGIASTPPIVPMLHVRQLHIQFAFISFRATYSQPNSIPPKLHVDISSSFARIRTTSPTKLQNIHSQHYSSTNLRTEH
jgi:hypothetical protein